ncbi:hypothetical protein RhiirA4_416988 [Rhizophagus irregularis]|uniref:Uncharacterized protein n=1 Tax=Rhizophagus irregularis TaxID=588596 RepID=A0A2I1G5G3_9GLOM|nr:hypothetical protein RhiirA4_416988 [Rhizophagus irregularis]
MTPLNKICFLALLGCRFRFRSVRFCIFFFINFYVFIKKYCFRPLGPGAHGRHGLDTWSRSGLVVRCCGTMVQIRFGDHFFFKGKHFNRIVLRNKDLKDSIHS